ncbi:hypothetical protein KAH37_00995 [bacterium]|nr:hypothetical protein [bacterium]
MKSFVIAITIVVSFSGVSAIHLSSLSATDGCVQSASPEPPPPPPDGPNPPPPPPPMLPF